MDSFYNDGNWYIYCFEWYILLMFYIKYFIDGKFVYIEYIKVLMMFVRYWIGVWFLNNWVGDLNFEIDYLEVEYFKYELFLDYLYVVGLIGVFFLIVFYLIVLIKKLVFNFLLYGNLDYEIGYMLIGDVVILNGELKIGLLGSVEFFIIGLNDVFEFILKFKVKVLNNVIVCIEYLDKDLNVISGEDIIVLNLNVNIFINFIFVINLVEGIRVINVIFEGINIIYDDLFINLIYKVN